ncbi:maltose ABC transporter permease MalF [Salmonella enterica]|nr:maltose ABC transporter permease MalF [Salmonella enterica]EGJ8778141.1 maltose ABC transporter permease MalF [Salmonella enterica]
MDVIKKKHWWQSDQLKWSVIGLLGLLVGYLVVLMYVQGEYLFAIMTLILSSAGLYIFANRKTYAWRYVYPGLAGMGLFVLFPLVCTIAIAFTNYSSTNQLTFERAQQVLMDRSYQAGKTYNFGLYPTGDEWQLALTDGETGKHYLSDAFSFGGEQKLQLKETDALPGGERANLRIITQNRLALNQITAVLPDESKVIMSSLRQFSGTRPLYTLADDGLLTNNQSGVKYRPNNDSGYYQSINADGSWGDEKLSPGYTVTIGAKNFTRVFTDEGIQKPFFAIFVWTVVFSVLTVVLTVAVGMVLACLVQWEALKGKAIYRVLLILPYAVPSFISILIFKGLFNQSFGEINMMLSALFGIKPAWFSDPNTARAMVIIVNTWLGYPYMMILCMGLLKAIPDDLYEASAMDGAGPFQNFFKITLPLLMVIAISLREGNFATGSLIPDKISWEHWRLALGFSVEHADGRVTPPPFPVLLWLWNSVKIAGITAIGIVALSTTCAYAFARMRFPGKATLLKGMLIFQMFPAVLSLVALYALFDRLGQYIPFIGLNTHGGVIFAYLGGIALHVWTIKGYFETIDSSLEEAAALDGATPWQAFRLVLLPLSVPILAVVFILSFIAAITEVPVASLLLRDVDSYTLAVGMQQYLNPQNYLWGDFAAAAVLSAIPITLVFLLAQRWLVNGLTAGGVKG